MTILSERMKSLREGTDITQGDIARRLGVSRSTVGMYERGAREPDVDSINRIASIFDVSVDYLTGRSNDRRPFSSIGKKGVKIPVLGSIPAGIPLDMIEDIEGEEEITEQMAASGKYFGLRIKGDSMEPRIRNGDIVIVRQQDDAESGDTVICAVNGYEATCKRLRKLRDGIELVPNNPSYEPMFFTNEEILSSPVRIIGKVVELRGKP